MKEYNLWNLFIAYIAGVTETKNTLCSPELVYPHKAIERFSFATTQSVCKPLLTWEGSDRFCKAFKSKYQFKCIAVAI